MKKNIFLICSGTEDVRLYEPEINNIENKINKIFYIIRNSDDAKIISSDVSKAEEIAKIISNKLGTTYETSKFLQYQNRAHDELSAYELIRDTMAETVLVVTHKDYIEPLILRIARQHGLSLCYDVEPKEDQIISLNLREKEMKIY